MAETTKNMAETTKCTFRLVINGHIMINPDFYPNFQGILNFREIQDSGDKNSGVFQSVFLKSKVKFNL